VPIKLDAIDIALLELLIKDGRKSFNQIAREIKASAPTVKTRYDRLVNVGLIKAVTLDLDLACGKIVNPVRLTTKLLSKFLLKVYGFY
jgi:DNA-binding Lrp family transcriptional regulator